MRHINIKSCTVTHPLKCQVKFIYETQLELIKVLYITEIAERSTITTAIKEQFRELKIKWTNINRTVKILPKRNKRNK